VSWGLLANAAYLLAFGLLATGIALRRMTMILLP
jgi:hypothetical protein